MSNINHSLTKHRNPLLIPLILSLFIMTMGKAWAWKVYVNPSVQTANVSPDGAYNEGYSMQTVATKLMTKLTNRGFSARNSAWLNLSGACSDAVSWDADIFVALHTNASGGSGWSSAHGTDGFYYQSSSGWTDPVDKDLTDRCVHKCVEKFNAWGRGYDGGTHADYPSYGYNLYVLSHTSGMNSTLIEGLFHTNQADTAVLKTDAGKEAYAQAIFEAVCDFYGWVYDPDIWNSTFSVKSYQDTMEPGTQAICWVEYKNTGNTTWYNSGTNPVRLGTWDPQDRASSFYTAGDWQTSARPTALDQASVAPNGTGRFTFTVTAPQQTGAYSEAWRLVAEGKSWFGDSSVRFNINVIATKGALSGRVVNSVKGSGVSGAQVSLTDSVSTSTDSDGYYSFADLQPGTYTVTVSRPFFVTKSTSATVTAGTTTACHVSLTPTDTQSPSTPTGLSGRGVSGTEIRLDWDPSTDDTGVAGYRIYRDGALVGTAATNAYTDTKLTPLTSHTYRVDAYDGADNFSGMSDQVEAMTLTGLVAVFADGFASLANWSGDPDTSANLSADASRNHGTYSELGSAKAPTGASRFMYHRFTTPYSSGKFEAWFYDSGTNDASRQGIILRSYGQDGSVAAAYFLGTYNTAPGATNAYSAGVYVPSVWAWSPKIQTRSVGWHKFAIELLPYTGSQDVRFYIDDTLKATMNRPSGADVHLLDRIHIGYNANVNADGWFDDVTFYAQAPEPAIPQVSYALGTDSIRWAFSDPSARASVVKAIDSTNATKATATGMKLSSVDETGLAPNTEYSRRIVLQNGALSGLPSTPTSCCTLSVPPSADIISCIQNKEKWYSNPEFTFNTAGGFGAGKVQYYLYAFDRKPTHTWDDTEMVWDQGSLTCTATEPGDNWYLHLRGYNNDYVPNGTLDLGPFYYAPLETFSTPPDFVKVGWNAISLPGIPTNPDPLVVLNGVDVPNSSLQFWRNDFIGGGYTDYGTNGGWSGPMKVGTAYWFMEDTAPRTLSFQGFRNRSDWSMGILSHPAAPYWVMIGHPFEHATPCNEIRFSTANTHPTPLRWPDAYLADIVESSAQGFDAAARSYLTVGPREHSVERDYFQPWYGYWLLIRTTEPVTITVPVDPRP